MNKEQASHNTPPAEEDRGEAYETARDLIAMYQFQSQRSDANAAKIVAVARALLSSPRVEGEVIEAEYLRLEAQFWGDGDPARLLIEGAADTIDRLTRERDEARRKALEEAAKVADELRAKLASGEITRLGKGTPEIVACNRIANAIRTRNRRRGCFGAPRSCSVSISASEHTMTSNTRSTIIETMAGGAYAFATGGMGWETATDITKGKMRELMEAALTALEASGMAVVPRRDLEQIVNLSDCGLAVDVAEQALAAALPSRSE